MVILNTCTQCDTKLGRNNRSELCSKHYKLKWKSENLDTEKQNNTNYYKENVNLVKEQVLKRYRAIKDTEEYKRYRTYKEGLHRAHKLKATPKWADLEAIKQIYLNCPIGYHVDHILPLRGKTLSGLHISYNLQYLPVLENIKKSNKLI
jgi:hypothetical protein